MTADKQGKDNVCRIAAGRIRGLGQIAQVDGNAHDAKIIARLDALAPTVDRISQTEQLETGADALWRALSLVAGERAGTHGDMVAGFAAIARLWNAYLAERLTRPLAPSEIGDLMELLKIARRRQGGFNPDDYVDGAGYAACAFECRRTEEESVA